jgi:DedD protein
VTVAPTPAAPPEKIAVAPQAAPAAAGPEAPVTRPEAKPEPEPSAVAKPAPKTDDGAKAKALLEGKPLQVAAAAEGRFVVQVGAFADPAKARAARLKAERAGLKTYTNVADTKEGKRVRVRVGPFVTRAEADKAAGKLKGLDLPAAILTL